TLPDRRRADEYRHGAVGFKHKLRGLLRASGAALDEAADGEAVVAAVNELALQLRLLGPADFLEATIERRVIVAAVELVMMLVGRDRRELVGHLHLGHEIAPAELDAVDTEVLGHHVEQALAEKIGLEAAGPAIGADRRLVGHQQQDIEL